LSTTTLSGNTDKSTVTGKICSVSTATSPLEITPVPEWWTPANCLALAKKVGAERLRLGCFYNGGWALGPVNIITADNPPVPLRPTPDDCGW
jgi:hypothetical protein